MTYLFLNNSLIRPDAEMAIGPDVIISSRLDLDITIRTYSTARTSAPFTVDSPLNGLSHILPPSFASANYPPCFTYPTDH